MYTYVVRTCGTYHGRSRNNYCSVSLKKIDVETFRNVPFSGTRTTDKYINTYIQTARPSCTTRLAKRIDQSDFTARFPGSANSAFSSEWRCVHANSPCFVSGR